MERRGFLKRLFGLGVGAAAMTVPALAKAAKGDTFTIEDAFTRFDGNKDMYYLKKDSLLNKELMKAIGDHYLPKEKFGNYLPVWKQYVPVKDEYTIEDFRQLIMYMEDARNHFDYFCDGQTRDGNAGLVRIIKDRQYDYYHIDLFQAYKNGQYGPKD